MSESIPYNTYLNYSVDDEIWKPIPAEEHQHFLSLINTVREKLDSGTNKEKGDSLESLMTYIYKRFTAVEVYPNVQRSGNQIDHLIKFMDGFTPTFVHENIGLTIIGESKNKKESITVREVADLNELLRENNARFGIFSSYNSFSKRNSLWKYAEGKRRKIFLSDKRTIIGFNINELETLTENNFYTMLKQKHQHIVDEIDDDYTDNGHEEVPYAKQLYQSLLTAYENGIIEEDSLKYAQEQLIKKYGALDFNI